VKIKSYELIYPSIVVKETVIFRIENYLYFVKLSALWAGFVSFTLEITCRQDARWQAAELKAGLVV